MTKKLLLLFVFCTSLFTYSQTPNLTENASVSVFTCGQGSELYSVFGHTAIRIKDAAYNLDVVFNYGAFDFNTENFYVKFVKGDLQYFIGASSYEQFIQEYQYENREVTEQTLALSLSQKQALLDKLRTSLYSSERTYTYKFIDRNCTTMVAEKINQTLGTHLIQKTDDTSLSYRAVLYPYFENHFWYKLGINCIFGYKTDTDATKLFLPIELLHSLDKATYQNQPLVSSTKTILKGSVEKKEFSFFNSIYFVLVLLLVILIINKKHVFYSYFIILGLLGLFFSLVGFYSFHHEISWNYNVLLFNPLLLVIPFVSHKIKWLYAVATCLILYLLFILNKPHLLLVLPFIITNAIIVVKLATKNKLLTSVK
jgi:hypothetical protein